MDAPEVARFRDTSGAIPEIRKGYRIGKHLIVAYASDNEALEEKPERRKYRLYYYLSGKRVFPNRIPSLEDAFELADFIDRTYGDYLEIVTVWPDADIINLAQWSIDPPIIGVRTFLALSSLADRDTITKSSFAQAWVAVESEARQFTRSYAYDPYKSHGKPG
jgi:hypothetical protein